MKAPIIYVVIKRGDFYDPAAVCWSFDRREAEVECGRLNGGDEWGAHVVEEVLPIGGVSGDHE